MIEISFSSDLANQLNEWRQRYGLWNLLKPIKICINNGRRRQYIKCFFYYVEMSRSCGLRFAMAVLLNSSGTCIGVNISERKSRTERTKKRKKRELVFFTARGATGTVVHRLDATRILSEL